jgi:hypothetical protein
MGNLPRNTEKPFGSTFRNFCAHRSHTYDDCIRQQWCNVTANEQSSMHSVIFLYPGELSRLVAGIFNISHNISIAIDTTVDARNLTWYEPYFDHVLPSDTGENL